MIYYSIFCLTTSIVCMIRVQWPAAKYAFRKEYMGFWITLFVVNNILAPILFLLVIFKDFIEDLYNKRLNTDRDDLKIFYKNLMNGGYGKYG